MTKLLKILALALGLCLLVAGLASISPAPAQGTAAAPVNITQVSSVDVNGKVPVTGTVTVGNLGSSTLPVSVTNFPATQQLSVTNFPATQQVSGTVNVGNLSSAPGSSPFAGVLNPQTSQFAVPSTINSQTVKALVVTEVSGFCTGIGAFNLGLQDFAGGTEITRYYFFVEDIGNGSIPGDAQIFPIAAQQTQIYVNVGHSLVIADATPGNGCNFDLSGYYVTQ